MLQTHHIEAAVGELLKPHEEGWKTAIHNSYKAHAEHSLKTFNEFWKTKTKADKIDRYSGRPSDQPPRTPFVTHPHNVPKSYELHPHYGDQIHAATHGTAVINHDSVKRSADDAFDQMRGQFVQRATEKLTHISGARGLTAISGRLEMRHGTIEGEVTGHVDARNHFTLDAAAKTNYRYGHNAADGHMTQYGQYPFTVKHAHVDGSKISGAHADDLAVKWGGVPLRQAERQRITASKETKAAWASKRDHLEKTAHAWRDVHETVTRHAKDTTQARIARDPTAKGHAKMAKQRDDFVKQYAGSDVKINSLEVTYPEPKPLGPIAQHHPKHAALLGLTDWPTAADAHAKLTQARAALAAHKEAKP